jgi:uncharacterized membrane protein YcaP (DUF421 family)
MTESLIDVEILEDCLVEYSTGKLKLSKGITTRLIQTKASKLVKEGKAIYVALKNHKMDASLYQNKMCNVCNNK